MATPPRAKTRKLPWYLRPFKWLLWFVIATVAPGESYRFTFRAAGTFRYVCSIHNGMDGTITVPIAVAKLSGPLRFRITVASASASGSWRNEVQVRRPGAPTWVRIARTSGTSVTYTPTKRGTYAFRSRVTNVTTGADSAWSPAVPAAAAGSTLCWCASLWP